MRATYIRSLYVHTYMHTHTYEYTHTYIHTWLNCTQTMKCFTDTIQTLTVTCTRQATTLDRLVYVAAGYHITCMYVNVCTYVGTYVRVHTSIFLSALSHSFCPGPDVEQTLSSSLIESVTALQHSATAPNSRQHFRLDYDSNALGHA